jgi:hypothetical protein
VALTLAAALAAALAASRPGGETVTRRAKQVEGRELLETRSYVTYTVEGPETLSAILRRCGLSLKPEVVRRMNPGLPTGDPLPAGVKLSLYIQSEP